MELLVTILICLLVFLSTYLLHNYTKCNAVQSSSIIGVLLGVILELFLHFGLEQFLNFLIIGYGVTFVGMTVKEVLGVYHQLLASLVFSIICFFTVKDFEDIGGILGTIAFISILFISGILKLAKWKNHI